MGNPESIPVVSQAISLQQHLSGDSEGALRTQHQFTRECLGVSQMRSAVEAGMGNNEAALATQWAFAHNMDNAVDSVPGIGHAKAAIHAACGDEAGADKAIALSGRAAGLAAGGAAAGALAGPGGAVAGIAMGLVAGAVKTSDTSRSGWHCMEDMDCDAGQNAAELHGNDVARYQEYAEEHGFEGFAIWNGTAFFRRAPSTDLRSRLTPAAGVKFYIFDSNRRMQRTSHFPPQVSTRRDQPNAQMRTRSASPTAAATTTEMDPQDIRFTHDQIANAFRNGRNLDDIIEQIVHGDLQADSFPPMIVVRSGEKCYSLNNRRLFVFRVLSSQGLLPTIAVRLVSMNSSIVQAMDFDEMRGRFASKWERSFTTHNDGESVCVRGSRSRYQQQQRPEQRAGPFEDSLPRSSPRSGRSRARIAAARHRMARYGSPDPFNS